MFAKLFLTICVSWLTLVPPNPTVKDLKEPLVLTPIVKLEGIYECQGSEGETEYHYTIKITKAGKNYAVVWISENGTVFYGIGTQKKDDFFVSWTNKGAVGYHIMTRKNSKELEGIWSMLGHDGSSIRKMSVEQFKERWTLVK